jgi:hypothetical protein
VKKLTASVLGFIAVFSPLEVLAGSNHSQHIDLLRAALNTGIDFKVNPPTCDRDRALGWYWANRNELVVCQQNKMVGSSQEVTWTEEDYDTLRHEVHHLVQDCMSRNNRDGHLGAVYENPIGLGKSVLGDSIVSRIRYAYRDKDEHTIMMELEAFSVASMNQPLEQVSDIQTYCM